jgi:hypothetical protein
VWTGSRFDDMDVICMDGGSVWNTNMVSAIERCREEVDDDSQITLDIVLCQGAELPAWDSKGKAEESYLRYKDIREYYDSMSDVLEFKMAFPNVNFRHLVFPHEKLPGGLNLLNFDNKTNTWPMQMKGREAGKNAQISGEGFYFAKMDEWVNNETLREQYPRVGDYIGDVGRQEMERIRKLESSE